MKPFFKNFNAQKEQILMVKHLNKLKPYFKRLPRLSEMNILSSHNSIAKCRTCYGHGVTGIRNQQLGTFDFTHCPRCSGSREMSTRLSDYDK